ncbi:TOTE conflict system archaeo-eukaryotic primase domain-containing protein [Streptomyces virginiae]
MGEREVGPDGLEPRRGQPLAKNKADAERVFWPLTDRAVYNHLSRETHLGLYPLLADDTCRLLAVDFDGKDGSDWHGDAAA